MSSQFNVPLSPCSFWIPRYFPQSAWIEHAPFAFWLIDALRPKRFVELGSHYGYSYFAFCQAIENLGISTAAYAVDTWQGDEHAGFYDNSVYEAVLATNQRYAAFSRLNRATFAEAVNYFSDQSLDLLHIDGRHFYEDVKEDFSSWKPKLTKDAIVLFHDTNVREREFGVWQFFEELSAEHATFQFIHGNGLGIVALGDIPEKLVPLFGATGPQIDHIRAVYASLGGLLTPRRQLIAKTEAIDGLLKKDADVSVDAAELYARISDWDPQVQQIRASLERYREIETSAAAAPAAGHAHILGLETALNSVTTQLEELKIAYATVEAKGREAEDSNELLRTEIRTRDDALAMATDTNNEAKKQLAERESKIASLELAAEMAQSIKKSGEAPTTRALLADMVLQERRQLQSLSDRVEILLAQNREKDVAIASLQEAAAQYPALLNELNAIQASTSWKLTFPLRRTLSKLPALRTPTRRIATGAYWVATGQIIKRLKARQASLQRAKVEQAASVDVSPPLARNTDDGESVPCEAARPTEVDFSVAVPFNFVELPGKGIVRVAAVVHLYYEDLAGELRSYLRNIPGPVDVFISTADNFRASIIESAFSGWDKGDVEVRLVPNQGRDIAPKLIAFADIYDRYEYVLFLHGKRSKHADVLSPWRHFLLESLVGSPEVTATILYIFAQKPSLGIVAAQHFEPMRHWTNWGGNFPAASRLAERMGFELNTSDPLDFPSGSMFWARTAAIKPLLDLKLQTEDFDTENNQKDATVAHAIERLFFHTCEHAGFDWVKIARPELYAHTPAVIKIGRESDLDVFFKRYIFRLLEPRGVKPRAVMPTPISFATPELFEHVQNRALGQNLVIHPDTRVAIGLVTFNNDVRELNAAIRAARVALEFCGLSTKHSLFLIDNGESTVGFLSDNDLVARQQTRGNVGFGGGHNQLMNEAFQQGFEIYIALNPDGIMHPGCVQALVQMLQASDGRALVEAIQFPSEHPKPYDPNTFDTPWVSGACLALSRAAYDDLSGFDEDFFMYCEDVDLSWRARAKGYALKTCARALFLHAVTNREVSPTTLRMLFESGLTLARKWGSVEFESWVTGELKARGLTVPQIHPITVPEEWQKIADFSHHFSFAKPRW